MKITVIKSKKRLVATFIGLFVLIAVVINGIGYVLDLKYVSVFAAARQIDKYQVRSELLMDAMEDVGVCCAEDAANVWASGLKKRSAALQYSVMTTELKKVYAKQLDSVFPNWVTGVSSPWVDSYKITKTEKVNENTYIFNILFSTKTSTGPAGDYSAILTVIKEDGFWRVTKIDADKQLYAYTGYKP